MIPSFNQIVLLLFMALTSVIVQIMFTAAFASANSIIVEIVAYFGIIYLVK